jgi:hypothetical protein
VDPPTNSAPNSRWDELRRYAQNAGRNSAWDALRQSHERNRAKGMNDVFSPTERDLTREQTQFDNMLEAERRKRS